MNEASDEHAKQIIAKIRYMTIATVDTNGQPWNTPVARSYDAQHNFYWISHKDSVHAQNIRQNNKIFIVIYDSTVPSENAWGVYIKARAFEVNDAEKDDEIAAAFAKDDPYDPPQGGQYLGDHPRRVYQAVPEKIWMNDSSTIDGNYIDTRKEVQLS